MRKSAYEMGISDWGPDLCSSDLLISGLVANLRYNANRKQARVRVFELGRVFLRDAAHQDGPLEVAGVRPPLRLVGAAWGPAVEEQWGVPAPEDRKNHVCNPVTKPQPVCRLLIGQKHSATLHARHRLHFNYDLSVLSSSTPPGTSPAT